MTITYTQEDCMKGMARYPDKYFDLAIVDPPYGIGINSSGRVGHYGGKGKTWDSQTPDETYFNELFRVSKEQVIWGANYFEMKPTRCFLIWDKQQPEGVSFASCEYAWTSFNRSAKTFYKSPINAEKGHRFHPTQKPVALYKWILKNYAKQGDLILDTHVGSASSLIACYDMGFDAVGFELDEDYYRESKQRLERFMSQLRITDYLDGERCMKEDQL